MYLGHDKKSDEMHFDTKSKITKKTKNTTATKRNNSKKLQKAILNQIEEEAKENDNDDKKMTKKWPKTTENNEKLNSNATSPKSVENPKTLTNNKRLARVLENEKDVIIDVRCDNKKKYTTYTSTPSGLRRRPLKAPQDVSVIINGDNN